MINNHDKNSNTFIGKARTLFNNLPYQIRSISSFKSFSREVKKYKKYCSIRPKQNIFNVTSEPIQPFFATLTSLILYVLLVTWKILFHFHSLLIYFPIYIITSKRFSQFCNSPTRFCWLMLVQCFMQFQACSIYVLLMLIRFIFNSAASSPFQVCSSSAISLCNICHLLIQF